MAESKNMGYVQAKLETEKNYLLELLNRCWNQK